MRTPLFSLATFVLGSAAALAQAPAAPGAVTPAVQTVAVPRAAEQKPEALEPQGFTYNAGGRRDPFVSLLQRGADTQARTRASGLAGLATAEVSLRGTLRSQGSFVGMLQGIDGKTYIVRAGDKLADGTIRSISADDMVILQQVSDPLALEKQREVRKTLRQTEEAK